MSHDAVPVAFGATRMRAEPQSQPQRQPRSDAVRRRRKAPPGLVAKAKFARFFLQVALKEHFAPRLHVRPLVAELFLTDNCNLKCTSCACWRTMTHKELNTEEWMRVIEQCVDLGLVKLNFTGGEPLLRRDTPRLIAHAHDLGVKSLHLNTNAILLDDARRAQVLEAGVRSFNISVDGPKAAVHDAVRGVEGSFERTLANLRALTAERRHERIDIRLSFTVLRTNVDALPGIARLAQQLGVHLYLNLGTDTTFLFHHAEVTPLTKVDRTALRSALHDLDALARRDPRGLPRFSDRRYVERHFDDLLQRGLPCAESQLKLMIHSTGEVGGCWGHAATHNVRERTLREIVDAADYRDEHARLFRKECVGCGSNYSLNLRWRPRTYIDDLSWRLRRANGARP